MVCLQLLLLAAIYVLAGCPQQMKSLQPLAQEMDAVRCILLNMFILLTAGVTVYQYSIDWPRFKND